MEYLEAYIQYSFDTRGKLFVVFQGCPTVFGGYVLGPTGPKQTDGGRREESDRSGYGRQAAGGKVADGRQLFVVFHLTIIGDTT